MYFEHAQEIWTEFPELAAGAVVVDGITAGADLEPRIGPLYDQARSRLAGGPESELPEIQAWRRTFAKMGLKPTQYRCASEALLRRFKKEGELPRIHPLIDICNAVSLATAIPIAVFDRSQIAEHLTVRRATGEETYQTFSDEIEHPEPGEVVFADAQRRAHARRWTNRQSGLSAIRPGTASALVVSEALHAGAADDVRRLVETVCAELEAGWPGASPKPALLSAASPRFTF